MKRRFRMQDRERAEGFTLVEMMVAVTLVALMALALWSVLRISVTSWKRGTEEIDANQRHRATMDLVQKQIASMYPLVPPLDLQAGTGVAPVFTGTEAGMQFISLCPLRFRDHPGLALVSYEVVRSDSGSYSLVERETRYLGGNPATQTNENPEGEPADVIFDGLESLTFEYCDPGTAELPLQWVRDWDATDQGRLPSAISMTMVSLDTRGNRQIRQMVIPITALPASTQQNFMDPFLEQRRRLGADDPRTRR